MKDSELLVWQHLALLAKLFPVRDCAVVGIGSWLEPWFKLLTESNSSNVLFVDADISTIQRFELNIPEKQGLRVEQQTISKNGGETAFYMVANRSESSLIPPDSLQHLWPNIQMVEERTVDSVPLSTYLEESGLSPNWLVIDCLPGVGLIDDAIALLAALDVVILRMTMDDHSTTLADCSRQYTDTLMTTHGFRCLGYGRERHPGLGHGLYVRDYSSLLSRCQEECALCQKEKNRLQDENAGLNHQNATLKSELDALLPTLKQLEDTVTKQKNAVAYLHEASDKALKSWNQSRDSVGKAIVGLDPQSVTELLEKSIGMGEHTMMEAKLLSLVLKLGEELAKIRHSMETRGTRQTERIIQQLESHMGIQYFLTQTRFLPDMHLWPISPDVALWIMALVSRGNYDLVLEYGSGTSTLLMAQTIQRSLTAGTLSRAPIQVAFEHLEKYHTKTADLLEQNGHRTHVQLELAPLLPYSASDDVTYSYYSCGEKLDTLSMQLANCDRPLKMFMLVDGPPGDTNRHARYPALPMVLDRFNNIEVDLLLDDYGRREEKEILDKWKTDLESRGVVYELEERKMEKGACLLQFRYLNSRN